MIIYLATYPRSGASLLRDLIFINWRFITANGYASNDAFPEKHDVRSSHEHPGLLSYQVSENERRLLLPNNALEFLTPERREAIGALPDLLFVKTHELPNKHHFAGEVAIQSVRHPAACLQSAWLLKQRFGKSPPSFFDVVNGAMQGGDWGDYHLIWSGAGIPLLRLRYEDICANHRKAIKSMADFLCIPRPAEFRNVPKSVAQQRNPARNLSAHEENEGHAATIWTAHGGVAKLLGY